MLWHVRRRTPAELQELLAGCRDDRLTYAPTGGSLGGPAPDGLVRRTWECALDGEAAFARAVAAIESWSVHRGSGLTVAVDGPLRPGTDVALDAPLPVGFVTAMCRVVEVVDEPDRFGFSYGTLPRHPECGEESFVVHRDDDGGVTFRVVALSRPAHAVARAFPPIAHRLQESATRRYLRAMADAVGGTRR
ncbi:MAG: DUF1990 family protein [Acidimicrobiia bacterium]